ncbi:MAG: glutamate synthase central domain-containing protein, partial [Candidatus Omnitrophota bacterium]|nr:glutamate synthase central domain-containing protein [Candidatus Omnitrophota bacterium]
MNQYPKKQGLYDPSFEHDACGVGFIAHLKGKKSHEIVRNALKILENLTHRGACGCDPETGDGAGILMQMPDAFFRKECAKNNIDLPPVGDYGAGMVFLPPSLQDRNVIEAWSEHIIHEEGQKLLGWRDVPHDSSKIGKVARSVQPHFKQIFIGRGEKTSPQDFERKLYVIRKSLFNQVQASVLSQKNYYYFCSLSTKTLVYKGQLMAEQVDHFFADLADPTMVSALAMVHSRYSTNTFPSWALAHPYRIIAHNGEINTLRGNINWMYAREKQFISDAFGKDIKKILPIVVPHGSDSATFDNVLEMLVLSGRSLPHAVMMMIPEAWQQHESMPEEKKAFYEYHSCLMEPWDGPASIAFSDGRFVGAVLDRNGLRPSRYLVTNDDLVVMASETGVLPIEPERVLKKGRLQPGKMFLIDMGKGRIVDDAELKHEYASRKPYAKWLKDQVVDLKDLPEPTHVHGLNEKTSLERLRVFGYTMEDIKMIIKPMITNGEEATGSMGADTPLAVLSYRPQLLFNYFKQLFAQVTNPPIDAIREEVIMAENVMLGSEGNLLDETPEHCHRLRIPRPVLANEELEKIRHLNKGNLKAKTFSSVFPAVDGPKGLEKGLRRLFKEADEAIKNGYTLLILSDRDVNKDNVPMPSLLACSGLHHHLIRKGTRTKVSLIIETGEAREMHHFAVLIGYGANAINPYLVYEIIEQEVRNGGSFNKAVYKEDVKNFLKATRKGLFKIISKMGISTIQSYCGAQIFEAVGLGHEIIDKYFTATPSRIGGIGIETVSEEMMRRHQTAYPDYNVYDHMLDPGGDYHWRQDGEHHQYNPQTIALIQHATRSNDYSFYKKYAHMINDQQTNLANIRGLLKFKK